jgi:predicted nuclease with RNAse H fold
MPLRESYSGAGAAAFGIDVGAASVHLVGLDLEAPPSVVLSELIHPFDRAALTNLLRAAAVVAIDAPAERSSLPHLGDSRLAAKFRRARCGEVALLGAGHAVPWVSPAGDELLPGWMATGFEIWSVAEELGIESIETFPHAVFARLANTVLRHKRKPEGVAARAQVLAPLLRTPAWLPMWSHDGLDALAAALVAWHAFHGTARRIDCSADDGWPTHDGSAIWLPPAAGEPASRPPGNRKPRLSIIAGGAQGPRGI